MEELSPGQREAAGDRWGETREVGRLLRWGDKDWGRNVGVDRELAKDLGKGQEPNGRLETQRETTKDGKMTET